ncbi:MAG: beta-propeller fold lactonase family protein [Candidatus Sulfotelmatobacter sp.]|jgi:6-phosphogluconolactonase (cycloisomerase 2 family)
MWTRFAWMVAILALVSIGFLMACNAKYSSNDNGLVVIPSQGGGPLVNNQLNGPVMETFSLDLSNGSTTEINNVNGPPTPGLPTAVVLDPAGANAYVIVTANPAVPGGSVTGIAAFPIASDGKLGSATTYALNSASVTVLVGGQPTVESVPVTPVALRVDSAGKLLFVANNSTSDSSGNPVPGSISVFSVSNGTLSEVTGSPFVLPVNGVNVNPPEPCTNQVACSSPLALAVTPTVYPPQYAYCSGIAPPTTENLYVPDSINNILLNYSVSSSGALTLSEADNQVGIPTGYMPDGVTVDPCNRFVYVSNGLSNAATSNTVSAYTICSTVSPPNCPVADFRALAIKGSPFAVSPGEGPGPLSMDAYGNYLYVVDTVSGLVSQFRVSTATGSLTPLTPPSVSASGGADSIAIRGDDSFVFVANKNPGTLSEYAINLQNGNLTPLPVIQTFNYPAAVAVK